MKHGISDTKDKRENENRIKVLHVDDCPEFVEMASEFLQREFELLDVETETDPTEAVGLLQKERFDCIVSDCTMPEMEMDGEELHSEVRSEYSDLPFVFFTGTSLSEFPEEPLSDESTTHMKKEIDVEQFTELSKHIREVVGTD